MLSGENYKRCPTCGKIIPLSQEYCREHYQTRQELEVKDELRKT